jgi:hypothetical protein
MAIYPEVRELFLVSSNSLFLIIVQLQQGAWFQRLKPRQKNEGEHSV